MYIFCYDIFCDRVRKKYERPFDVKYASWCHVFEKRYGILIANYVLHYDYSNCPIKPTTQIKYSDAMYRMKRYYEPFDKL